MATKSYYVGSAGPFFYDDEDAIQPEADNPDAPVDMRPQNAFGTDGQLRVESSPTDSSHVARKHDVTSAFGNMYMNPFYLEMIS